MESAAPSTPDAARNLTAAEHEKLFYQELLAAVPYPIAVVSAQLEVTAVNRAFQAQFAGDIEDSLASAELGPLMESFRAEDDTCTAVLEIEGTRFRVHASPFRDRLEDGKPGAVLVFEPDRGEPVSPPPGVWFANAHGTPVSAQRRPWPVRAADTARVEAAFQRAHMTGQPCIVDYGVEMSDGAVARMCDRIQPAEQDRLAVLTTVENSRAAAISLLLQRSKVEAVARLSSRLEADTQLAGLRTLAKPLQPRPEILDLNDLLRRTGIRAFLHLDVEPCYISVDRLQMARAIRAFAGFASARLAPDCPMVFRTGVREIIDDQDMPPAPGPYIRLEIGTVTGLSGTEADQWLEPFALGGIELMTAAQLIFAMGGGLWLNPCREGHEIQILIPQAGVAAPRR